jgi:phage-related baseplate assembly protein
VLDRGKPSVMVEMVILSATGNGAPSAALVQAVRDRVTRDDVKLLTDTVVVRAAVIVEYDVVATQYIRSGPDPNLVRSLGVTALRAAADRQKRIGGDVPRNALDAALYVPNVDRVEVQSPSADIVTQRHQAAHLRDITLNTVIVRD